MVISSSIVSQISKFTFSIRDWIGRLFAGNPPVPEKAAENLDTEVAPIVNENDDNWEFYQKEDSLKDREMEAEWERWDQILLDWKPDRKLNPGWDPDRPVPKLSKRQLARNDAWCNRAP